MKNKLTFYFILGLIILITPYIFWFILGENSFVLIHDNLDSEFVYVTKLLQDGNLFGYKNEISGIMNGLPRSLLRSPLNVTFILFAFFKPIYAYILNHLTIHIIGYIGMFLLLKKYFITNKDWLVAAISLLFGFVSYYHIQYGISISGQPILLFAFLNLLYGKHKWYDFIIVVLFPFYSFLVVTLPFFIPFLVIIGATYYKKEKKLPLVYIIGLISICIVYLLVEFPIISTTFFNNEFISHRTEWFKYHTIGPSLEYSYNKLVELFKTTQYHSGILNPTPILFAVVAVLYRMTKKIKTILLTISFIIVWAAFSRILIFPLYERILLLKTFNSERFYFLLPFLWLTLLGLTLNELDYSKQISKFFAIVILFLTIKGIYDGNTEFKNNFKLLTNQEIKAPTFRQFFDVNLFNQIKEKVGKKDIENYNFLSVGLFPSIAQYNGFRTIDSYQNNYELNYKQQFRKIIEKELSKSKALKKYFDFWGSRCYIFSSELGKKYLFSKNSKKKIKSLQLNTKQIKQMGGKYLISALPIKNYKKLGLRYLNFFESKESYWILYLYELK